MARVKIAGEEFVRRILEGERDFSRVTLKNYEFSEDERFREFYEYLLSQDFQSQPLDFSNSWFQNVRFNVGRKHSSTMRRLSFPYIIGNNLYFVGSNLKYVDFRHSSFREASFREADLQYTDFRFCDFYDADFDDARVVNTDFRGARNLRTTRNMERAYFWFTLVTPEERKIFEEILSRRLNFLVRESHEDPYIY